MNTIAPSDIPLPRIRRKRRIAVLALRLPRFLPHAVPAAAANDGGGTAHACNTERSRTAAAQLMPATPN